MSAFSGADSRSPTRGHAIRDGASIVAGALLLILATPLLALVALLVRVDSPGRVLERDRREDDRGRPYELLSFRTTPEGSRTDAHARLRSAIGTQDAGNTRVGRWILHFGVYRLPRLVNVARGELRLL